LPARALATVGKLEICLQMPLSDGIEFCAEMFADMHAFRGDERPALFGNVLLEKVDDRNVAEETNSLGIFLFRSRQSGLSGDCTNFRLHIIADGKEAMFQLALRERPEKIALIFIFIFGLEKRTFWKRGSSPPRALPRVFVAAAPRDDNFFLIFM